MPTPRISPVRVIMLSVMPAKFMAKRVIIMESGIDIAIMIVVLNEQRKM